MFQLLHCISKLYKLPITVQHLQETGIGRTVNALRKDDGEVGVAAKALVAKWKAMVAAEESSDDEAGENDQGKFVFNRIIYCFVFRSFCLFFFFHLFFLVFAL